MSAELPPFLLRPTVLPPAALPGKGRRRSLADQGVQYLAEFLRTTYLQWEMAQREGLLQGLDARVKLLFLVAMILVVSVKKTVLPELAASGLVLCLALCSRLDLVQLYKRVLLLAFFFGFLLSLPASLNLFVPGTLVLPLLHLSAAHDWWIYHVPAVIGITGEGLHTVALLSSRVLASVSLSLLVIYTTPLPEFLKALKTFRVPDPFLMVIALSLKFIFVFVRTLEEVYLAQKGRSVAVSPTQGRAWVAGRMAFLFRKTQHRYNEVFKAMLARGFAGEVSLTRPGRLRPADWLGCALLLGAGALVWAL